MSTLTGEGWTRSSTSCSHTERNPRKRAREDRSIRKPAIAPPFSGGSPAWGLPLLTKKSSTARPASEPAIAPIVGAERIQRTGGACKRMRGRDEDGGHDEVAHPHEIRAALFPFRHSEALPPERVVRSLRDHDHDGRFCLEAPSASVIICFVR